MMKIWLSAVMVILVIIAVDITVIGWDRFISGIGSLVDGQRHAKQVSPDTAQPCTAPPRLEPPPPEARPTLPIQMDLRGSFGDGVKVVGEDIKPGTYRTRARAPGCYWERLAGFSGEGGDRLANGNESGPVVVTISASDKGFVSRKCGLWTPDLSAITKSLDAPFSDGTYIVGTDIAPGMWRADAPESCYWARLRGFSGGGKDTISNANYMGTVTIVATDKGFKSHHCGRWTLFAPLGPSETRQAGQMSPNTAATTAFAPQQHPYFPLQRNTTWTYGFPTATDQAAISQTVKVVKVDAAENTYVVEQTMRMATLPPTRPLLLYEVRGGNVLKMGGTTWPEQTGFWLIPAPIVLKANVTKGMHWKAGPKEGVQECDVLAFVTVAVPAGKYTNVAKVRVKETHIDPQTGAEELMATTIDYYAPNVGLVKEEFFSQEHGRFMVFKKLVAFTPGAP